MRKDKVGALVILAFSIVYGAMALNIPEAPGIEGSGVTPSSLPIALSAMGIVTSLLILILPAARRTGGNVDEATFTAAFKGLDRRCAVFLFLLMVGYGLTLKPFGFLISTILFLCGGFWVMGERRIKLMLLVSIGVTVGFWFVLTQLLRIYLEPGVLYFLGQVSPWLTTWS
jgi:putative tricarboxylic transport membrane protein